MFIIWGSYYSLRQFLLTRISNSLRLNVSDSEWNTVLYLYNSHMLGTWRHEAMILVNWQLEVCRCWVQMLPCDHMSTPFIVREHEVRTWCIYNITLLSFMVVLHSIFGLWHGHPSSCFVWRISNDMTIFVFIWRIWIVPILSVWSVAAWTMYHAHTVAM